jgi:hypothetical protein
MPPIRARRNDDTVPKHGGSYDAGADRADDCGDTENGC